MQIRVRDNNTGDLADDLAGIAARAPGDMSVVVRKNINAGNVIARRFARAKAGIHGKNYYKRLSAEMTGLLRGEYGPTGIPKSDFVGVGFRHGVNLDLPNSADIIAPKFARDVSHLADRWFW